MFNSIAPDGTEPRATAPGRPVGDLPSAVGPAGPRGSRRGGERRPIDVSAGPPILSLLDRTVTMAVIDARRRVSHVGEALLAISGHRRGELLGRPCRELLIDDDRRRRHAITRAVARGGAWRGEIGIRSACGAPLRLDAVIAALPGADGVVTGCLVAGLDITDRAFERERERDARRASTGGLLDQVELQARLALALAEGERREADLESALRRLQSALEARAAVLAAIDRVVPTSVAAISERTDLLAGDLYHGFPTETRFRHLDAVQGHAESLALTVRSLLVLAGLEAPTPPAPPSPTSPDRLLHAVTTVVRDAAEARGHRLEIESVLGDREVVDLDVPRVRQLLVGMITAEIAHGHAATITLATGVERDVHGAVQLMARVGGRRRPFSDAEMAAVACPAAPELVPTAVSDEASVPLAVAAELARELGGTLRAECGRDGTATLSVRLPVRRHRERPGPAAIDAGRDRAGAAGPLAGRRVLVAEDFADHAVLLDDALRRAGAEVTTVTNGAAAVRAITAGIGTGESSPWRPPFDAVLLDMLMPVMDGYATARLLRRRGIDLPIVAVTANVFAGAMEECLDAGCTAYVAKPIDRIALVEHVAETIAVHRAGIAT